MARTIKDEWQSYAVRVLPLGCPDVQRIETRRGFYAGALAATSLLLKAMNDSMATNDEREGRLMSILEELDHFGEELEAGRA